MQLYGETPASSESELQKKIPFPNGSPRRIGNEYGEKNKRSEIKPEFVQLREAIIGAVNELFKQKQLA